MKAEITFDTIIEDTDDKENIEGCYRIALDDWKVYFFTKGWRDKGPKIFPDVIFSSGIHGVQVYFPKDEIMNKEIVKKILGEILAVTGWDEVIGPDSLELK